jgi:cytochrome c oxidase cbb3-type subunit 1
MEKFMSQPDPEPPEPRGASRTDVLAVAAWHSLLWLVVSCSLGLLLGTLLLFPQMNEWLGEWSYGRWMPLHLNLNLYGWCSLPLVAWLLKVYQADQWPAAPWVRAALWSWSTALFVGAVSWLTGHSSGKLFLDWQGYALTVFVLALFFLWLVLAWSCRGHWRAEGPAARLEPAAKIAGLLVLLGVPFTLAWSASPGIYPPVNPDTGGPTGASLLESTLGIVLLLLVLPFGVCPRRPAGQWAVAGAWSLFVAENILCLSLGRGNHSHREPAQFLSLGSLLLWVPTLPAYFNAFAWPATARRWRNACLGWWGLLVTSAWLMFLPGLLDHFKFTDALVGHAHLAMAGFVSSLNLLLLVTLLGEKGRGLNTAWAFAAWQTGTLGYVLIMVLAGCLEGSDPAFTMVPGTTRNVLYGLRLVCGGLMLAAAIHWWREISRASSDQPPAATQMKRPGDPVAAWSSAKTS